MFVSYAQNREDVVLWRALGRVPHGRYVEVGANHPRDHSITRAFYDRGWSGITVEPVGSFADLHRAERPRDTLVQAAVTSADVESVVLHEISDTGLSTLVDAVSDKHAGLGWSHTDIEVRAVRLDTVLEREGWGGRPIHFLVVDTEGAERTVLESIDLSVWRPWVLVIEATAPLTTEPTHHEWEDIVLGAGYEFCLFDGLSRFYVSSEKADELREVLSFPAFALDDFVDAEAHQAAQKVGELLGQRDELLGELRRWRAEALEYWSELDETRNNAVVPVLQREIEALRAEIDATHSTLSWRVTRPLRAVRRLMGRS